VGAGLQYGLTRNLDLRFDYDYIDADLHTQALTFGGQWKFAPGAVWNPFVGAGLGFGKPFAGEGWDHFSLKLFGGVERELATNVAIQPVIGYQFVDGKDPFGSVHTIEPGIRLVYYFGTLR
jgi:opacity protein-like surface antigen